MLIFFGNISIAQKDPILTNDPRCYTGCVLYWSQNDTLDEQPLKQKLKNYRERKEKIKNFRTELLEREVLGVSRLDYCEEKLL